MKTLTHGTKMFAANIDPQNSIADLRCHHIGRLLAKAGQPFRFSEQNFEIV